MKENQRTRLSKKLLKDALTDILQKKIISKVTIKEICQRAELNRTTFYKYYSDQYALFNDIENEIIDMLRKHLPDCEDVMETVLSFFAQNAKLAKVLFNSKTDDGLPQKIFTLPEVRQRIKRDLGKSINDRDFYILCLFVYNGVYALIKDWVNSGFNISVKEFSRMLKALLVKFDN